MEDQKGMGNQGYNYEILRKYEECLSHRNQYKRE
jgi:hypothetical protein